MFEKFKRFVLDNLNDRTIKNISTIGKAGYFCKCPGTVGSAIGIIWYLLAFPWLNSLLTLVTFGISILFGIVICTESERIIGKKDPAEVIIDEVLAMPLCFFGIAIFEQPTILTLIIGFAIFRFFDIKKPFGINELQVAPGGLGIMLDDVLAALYTNISLHIISMILF